MKRNLTTLLLLLCALPALWGQTRAELLEKAEAGDAEAQGKLGECYYYGMLTYWKDLDTVPRDYDAAEKWYLRAAGQGYGDAYFHLGLLYQYNKKNRSEAIRWYKKHADYTLAEWGEANLTTLKNLRELGVDYDPAPGRSSYASTSSSGSSGSSSSSSGSSSSGKLLARGTYTISSQGRSQNTGQYTGVAGPDRTVTVEFYDDYITVDGIHYDYTKTTSSGWKVYEGSDTFSSAYEYYVGNNYNMRCFMPFSAGWISDTFEYAMVKGSVEIPKAYSNSGSYGSYGSGTTSGYSSGSSSSSSRHTCPRCHGSGTIVRESSVATYGNDRRIKCGTCGKYYWASSGHSHITCTQCHGKGYY